MGSCDLRSGCAARHGHPVERSALRRHRFGAAALHHAPQGRLAERVGDGVVGLGSLDAVTIPVNGGAWNAKAALGAIGINWRAAEGFRANFGRSPLAVDMTLGARFRSALQTSPARSIFAMDGASMAASRVAARRPMRRPLQTSAANSISAARATRSMARCPTSRCASSTRRRKRKANAGEEVKFEQRNAAQQRRKFHRRLCSSEVRHTDRAG